ncbi:hypothetical protein FOXYS1_16144, partial [Fusarium oxysporum]
HAAEPVNHIIKITSTAAAAAESPGKPSYVQRAAIAKAVVRELRRRADEDDLLDLFVHVHGTKDFTVGGIDDPANEPAVAPITKYDNPAPKFLSKVDQFVNVEPTPATAKVAWTAGQNKLVDDAAHRASQARPDNVVARILPCKCSFRSLWRCSSWAACSTSPTAWSIELCR